MINHENTPSTKVLSEVDGISQHPGIEVVEYTFVYAMCIYVSDIQLYNIGILYTCIYICNMDRLKKKNEDSQVLQKLGQFVQFTHESMASRFTTALLTVRYSNLQTHPYTVLFVFRSKPQKKRAMASLRECHAELWPNSVTPVIQLWYWEPLTLWRLRFVLQGRTKTFGWVQMWHCDFGDLAICQVWKLIQFFRSSLCSAALEQAQDAPGESIPWFLAFALPKSYRNQQTSHCIAPSQTSWRACQYPWQDLSTLKLHPQNSSTVRPPLPSTSRRVKTIRASVMSMSRPERNACTQGSSTWRQNSSNVMKTVPVHVCSWEDSFHLST